MFSWSQRNIKTIICVVLLVQLVILFFSMTHRQVWISIGSGGDVTVDDGRSVTTETPYDNDTLESFLAEYGEHCEQNHVPKASNYVKRFNVNSTTTSLRLCPCVPDALQGHINISSDEELEIGDMELEQTELTPGGTWFPRSCQPRQRIAIIIPFRDREEHLRSLLNILHPMLQRQMLHYTIFVIEQSNPAVFNKAALMNSGFTEANAMSDFDCYIFHDVDMLPENDGNFYTCSDVPRHVGSHIDKWNYCVPYPGIFGGVTAFTSEQFKDVNGFSNLYYGWGGEDDDMYSRILARNLTIVRFSKTVARYRMIKHKSDAGNPYNVKSGIAWKFRPQHYKIDGLNSLRYHLVEHEARPLYFWMLVTLPPHPSYFRRAQRSLAASVANSPSASLHSIAFSLGLVCLIGSRTSRVSN